MTKEEIAERLKTARSKAGFRTAREAAESLGVNYQTYAAHENGHRAFDIQAVVQYARRFRVSTDWLLTDRGAGPGQDFDSTTSIRGADEILDMLKRIDGLKPADATTLLAAIQGVIQANAAASPERGRPDDRSEPASSRREASSSR